MRSRGPRFGRMKFGWSVPPGVSLFASPSVATGMPDPLSPVAPLERPVRHRALPGRNYTLSGQLVGFARGVRPKRDRAPGDCRGAQRGEAPESGWIFWIYPWKGAIGKNMREGMRSGISRDGRMNSGWAATSPYVRLLRCLYSMQCLCLKRGDPGDPRRIRGLRRGLPVSRPARLPGRPLRSCNCFLFLMAFLQTCRVPA